MNEIIYFFYQALLSVLNIDIRLMMRQYVKVVLNEFYQEPFDRLTHQY